MIRKLLNGDIDRVADIWLKTNLKAHYFISNQYWKSNYEFLRLNVYQKNARAISFYQREGFIIQCEDLDEDTGEKEYTMLWKRK